MSTRFMRLTGVVIGLAMVVSACTVTVPSEDADITPQTLFGGVANPPRGMQAARALVPFDACEPFLDYVIGHAVDLVGPYGLEDPFSLPWVRGDVVFEEQVETMAADGAAGSPSFSGTNVQVVGVDEPDIVKTDGERVVLLSEGNLIVVDVSGAEPEETGRLAIGDWSVQSLFLSGDTAFLFGSAWMGGPVPLMETEAEFAPVPQTSTMQLIEVDIGDEPEIVRTMTLDGQFISGRMVGDAVRLVLTSGPVGFEWSYPSGSGLRAERKAVEENREIVRNSTPENWIPYYVVADADGEVVDEGILFDCDRASRPEEFSGLNMLSVITIDIADGLDIVDTTGVLATGDTVYASADSLYVATQTWQARLWAETAADDDDRPQGITTEIHKFDISSSLRADYVASGKVTGYLLNQFAMDEHRGLLRVASTTSPNWWGSGFDSESMVTVLVQDDGELVEIGRADGLGRTEQIYSVRFIGDAAYVVTFRQTDPLYTIDLSNPARPKMVGELKILGYSAYLHPLGEGLLLGVGQDATESGRIEGTQVSVFDVTDPADPTRIDQYTLSEGSSSQVEYDHHAFLYWEPERLAMIPIQQWWWGEKGDSAFVGAVGLTVDEDGDLREIRRVAHPGGDKDSWDWRAQILRSIVIGDSVYTVSAKGIMKSDIDSLAEEAWLGF